MTGFVVALVLAVVILGLAFIVLSTYNEIVGLAQRLDKAWANIDVALKQRYDELPNLVEAVRGLMGFEQSVLERVTQARAGYRPEAPIPQQAATSEETSGAVKSLLATVENYPDLTAHENVMSLQAEIARLEGVIADRRELYNDMVYRYDARIQQLPAVLLASLLGWRPRPYFKAQPAETAVPDTTLSPG
ncbi:MAG TPA: LemA family protein [Candidatus Sulfotelmatobacter sp.]|nr:LemA family protein [Candidatus Sulfotelmatobacter sp.]